MHGPRHQRPKGLSFTLLLCALQLHTRIYLDISESRTCCTTQAPSGNKPKAHSLSVKHVDISPVPVEYYSKAEQGDLFIKASIF